jgi:tripartite-type tricarboxylate transporter receptor subunit TctC
MRIRHRFAAFLEILLVWSAAAALSATAHAETYPNHPVNLVIPFAAGGPSDVMGRLLAAGLSVNLGQSVIVTNLGGAGGNVGAASVAHAAADGYTLLYSNTSMATSPALNPDLKYDPVKDLAPIGMVSIGPIVLLGRRDLPAKDFAQLVAYLKKNAEKATIGTSGVGAPSDLCARMFTRAIGARITIVPYKGISQAWTDLLGGRIDLLCDSATSAVGQVKAGNARPFAVQGDRRLAGLPDVPTFPEVGVKELVTGAWTGLYAPRATPKPVLGRLVSALQATLQDKDFRAGVAKLGSEQIVTRQQATPEALSALLKSEIAKWTPVLKGVLASGN